MSKDSAAAWLIQSVQQPRLTPGQEATPLSTLEIVALTAEYRRLSAGGHNWRVAHLAALLAETFGFPNADIDLLKGAAPLHDIGTIFIPEQILRKPEELTPEEFSVVKRHVELGSRLVQASDAPLLQLAQIIIENHHERFDGSGYPAGKRGGSAIPLPGQIVALADVFDTLTHAQSYRPALSIEASLDLMLEARGKTFAPNLIDALFTVIDERYWLVRDSQAPPQPAQREPSPQPELSPQPEPSSGREVLLAGKLGALNLFDLLSSLTQNNSSGHLYLEFAMSQGFIVLTEGRIVHSSFENHPAFENQSGEAALLALFSKAEHESNARFRLEAAPLIAKPLLATIQTPTEKLLFDIAVKLDHELAKRKEGS